MLHFLIPLLILGCTITAHETEELIETEVSENQTEIYIFGEKKYTVNFSDYFGKGMLCLLMNCK